MYPHRPCIAATFDHSPLMFNKLTIWSLASHQERSDTRSLHIVSRAVILSSKLFSCLRGEAQLQENFPGQHVKPSKHIGCKLKW